MPLLFSSHCTLTLAGRRYSWHSGIGSTAARAPNALIVDGWKCLVAPEAPPAYNTAGISTSMECTTGTAETFQSSQATPSPKSSKSIFRWTNSTPKEANAPKEVVLRFIPPHSSLVHGEFILDPSLTDHCATFLISAILLASGSKDWKYSQSTSHSKDVEKVLVSDHAGNLPPYSASASASGSNVRNGHRGSHSLHRTISDSRQWRWSQNFNPSGRRRRPNSSGGVNYPE